MPKTIFKSIGAIVVGFLTVAVLSVLTDMLLEGAGIFPSPEKGLFITWMLLLALTYRTIYTVAGGYITAKLSPNKPMKHVTILASIGTLFAILGVMTNLQQALGPNWYPVALAVLSFPSVWVGGKLKTK
ncbi:MAG: hypothetical protein ABI758_04815 [Candidatus Woesebacteria bacterium]